MSKPPVVVKFLDPTDKRIKKPLKDGLHFASVKEVKSYASEWGHAVLFKFAIGKRRRFLIAAARLAPGSKLNSILQAFNIYLRHGQEIDVTGLIGHKCMVQTEADVIVKCVKGAWYE